MRFLKWFLFFLCFLALLVAGTLTLLWVKPEILFNEARLRQALAWAPPELKVHWDKLDWRFFSRPGWSKRTTLAVDGLCASLEGAFAGCAPSLRLDLTFTLEQFRPRITGIQQLELEVAELTLPASAEETAGGPLPDLRAPDFSDYFPPYLDLSLLGSVRLQLSKLTLESREGPPTIVRVLLTQKENQKKGSSFRLEGEMHQGETKITLSSDLLVLPVPALVLHGQWQGTFGATANATKVGGPLELRWERTIQARATPSLRIGRRSLRTEVELGWSTSEIDLAFGPLDSARHWRQFRLGVGRCSLKSQLDPSRGYPRDSAFQCPFTLEAKPRLPQMPRQHAQVRATLALRPKGSRVVSAVFSLRENSEDPFIESRIEADGKFELDLERSKVLGEPELSFSAMLRMPEVQVWKKSMERTPLAVPAPFHVLSGPIEANITLDRWSREEAEVNVKLTTDLHGPTQAVVTASEGKMILRNPLSEKRRFDLEARSVLKDLRLEAPPLGLAEPPQFIPDSRFETTATEASSSTASAPSNFHWKLRLETEKPAHIQSNLLSAAVPLSVNLNFGSASATTGYVEVQKMPLKFFRDLAEIQRIKVTFSPGSESGQLDGLLTRNTSEVQIRILILGSTEAPRIEFESDPPLSRSQILSVLLFNKSLNELTEDEASSTQSVGQALSDRALGLFSLVFLSSTPIQSVGYDPETQTYSARVRLDGKTTLSVSSNFPQGGDKPANDSSDSPNGEKREFTVRRQLKGRWALRTELRQEENRPDVIITLLEWFKRF